ncbi:hypothetical protein MMC12_005036 [Toensbergia leucococca]|nr:hypothetical protein [Toensbergia leucococca]
MNTLNKLADAVGFGQKRRNPGTLETVSVSGDNVGSNTNTIDLTTSQSDQRPTKRSKLLASIPSDESVEMIHEQDDVDPLSMEGHTVAHISQSHGKSNLSSAYSHGSGFPRTVEHVPGGSHKEFRGVENTMASGPKATKRRAFHCDSQSRTGDNGNTTPSLLAEPGFLERAPKPRYNGTAREQDTGRSIAKGTVQRSKQRGEPSPHFDNRSEPKIYDLLGDKPHSQRINRRSEPQDVNLRNQFVPTDGTRRSKDVDISLSSDELGSENPVETYEIVTRVSPPKLSRSSSPTKAVPEIQSISPPRSLDVGLEPSNIASSNFSTFRRGHEIQNRKSAFNTRKTRHETDPWVTELHSINTGQDKAEDSGEGTLALQYNSQSKIGTLEVMHAGINLPRESGRPQLRIRTNKILKAIWAPCSLKLRFELSKTGTDDNRVDLVLKSEKNVSELLKLLQQKPSHFRLVEKDRSVLESLNLILLFQLTRGNSQHMDKIFQMRSSQAQKNPVTRQRTVEQEPTDEDFILSRNRRREERGHLSKPELPNPKRRRTVLTRTLSNGDYEGKKEASQLEFDLPSTVENLSAMNRSSEYFRARGFNSKKPSNIDQIIEKFCPTLENPHMTRSRNASSPRTKVYREVSPQRDETPQMPRYSLTHGLGPTWLKPLMYPKIGKKKTTVEWSDLERLDEGQFLNDNLIGFYLRWLEHDLEMKRPDLFKRVYFFNTYFFASLTNNPNGKSYINYDAVQKWTRSVDIFTYDYLVVPINESAHWYVAIICSLPALDRGQAATEDEPIVAPAETQVTSGETETESTKTKANVTVLEDDNVVEDHAALVQGSEVSNEPNARASFAELSLEPDHDHVSINSERIENASPRVNGIHQNDEIDAELQAKADAQDAGALSTPAVLFEVAADDPAAKFPSTAKKGKRKSSSSGRKPHPDQPAIVIFDSLGMTHSPTVKILKEYLHHEGKAKRGGMEWDDSQLRGATAKQIPLQDNYCDCGLFLLGYVQKFLADPGDFVTKILRREHDEEDWQELKPAALRARIRSLVQGLHAEQEEERKESLTKAGKYHGKPTRTLNHSSSLSKTKPQLESGDLKGSSSARPETCVKVDSIANISQPIVEITSNSPSRIEEPKPSRAPALPSSPTKEAIADRLPWNDSRPAAPESIIEDDSLVVIGDSQPEIIAPVQVEVKSSPRQAPKAPPETSELPPKILTIAPPPLRQNKELKEMEIRRSPDKEA